MEDDVSVWGLQDDAGRWMPTSTLPVFSFDDADLMEEAIATGWHIAEMPDEQIARVPKIAAAVEAMYCIRTARLAYWRARTAAEQNVYRME